MAYLIEMQKALQSNFPDDPAPSLPTLCRALQNEKPTWKVLEHRAMQRDAHERNQFKYCVRDLPADFFFLHR